MTTLDRPVRWQKVSIIYDDFGQGIEFWKTHKTVWAALEPTRGFETDEARQKVFIGNARFIVRFDEGWQAKDRLVDELNVVYEIVSIQEYQSKKYEVNTRRGYIILDCQLRDSENTGRDNGTQHSSTGRSV